MEQLQIDNLLHFKYEDPIFLFRNSKNSIRDWREHCCYQPYNNAENHLNSPDCHSYMSMPLFLPLIMFKYLQRFIGIFTSCISIKKIDSNFFSCSVSTSTPLHGASARRKTLGLIWKFLGNTNTILTLLDNLLQNINGIFNCASFARQ